MMSAAAIRHVDQALAILLVVVGWLMLVRRRLHSLVRLLRWQGVALLAATLMRAAVTGDFALYASAALTALLKVGLLPAWLHRLLRRLGLYWDRETVDTPLALFAGLAMVVTGFGIAELVGHTGAVPQGALGVDLALALLAFLLILIRGRAIAQMIGFLALDNAVVYAAVSTAQGMPTVMELGLALDVLMAVLIFGVFIFHIREKFDSLDIHETEVDDD